MTTMEWLLAKASEALGSSYGIGAAAAATTWLAEQLRQRHRARHTDQLDNRKQDVVEVAAAFAQLKEVVEVLREEVRRQGSEMATMREALDKERGLRVASEEELGRARRDLRQATHQLRTANQTIASLRQALASVASGQNGAVAAVAGKMIDATATPVTLAFDPPGDTGGGGGGGGDSD